MTAYIKTVERGEAVPTEVSFRSGEARLAGTLFHTARPAQAVAILNGATGVPHSYYRHFAAWLAREKGIACLTYDYRDFGASAKGPARTSRATMADWGVHDQFAAREAAARMLPDLPIWVIGHSLGGLALPFQPNPGQVARMITVASGPVHTSDHPWRYQPVARAFWFLYGPLLVATLGYLPGKALGLGADLPAGVYWQWRRWCTSRGFNAGDFGTALPLPDLTGVTAPITFVAIEDDVMVPPAAVWRLMRYYEGADRQQRLIKPAEFGLKRVGHIGFFRRDHVRLWEAVVE